MGKILPMQRLLFLTAVLPLAACHSTHPTAAQCDSAYAVALQACEVLHDPKAHDACITSAGLAHLVCLVWSNQPPPDAKSVKGTNTQAARLAEVYGLVAEGKMSAGAAEEYVTGGASNGGK